MMRRPRSRGRGPSCSTAALPRAFGTRTAKTSGKSRSIGKTRDGVKVTATNVFTKIDDDHFSFQFKDRTRDGKAVPDDKPIKMKRVQ